MHRPLSVVAALGLMLGSTSAFAHAVGLSQGEYRLSGHQVRGELTFTAGELQAAAGEGASMARWVGERIEVLAKSTACQLSSADTQPAERDGVTVALSWSCAETTDARLNLHFFAALPAGHRHLVGERVLHAGNQTLQLEARGVESGFASMTVLGIEHILTGWDHLLFLLGLVVVAARKRDVLKMVTAFTVAHSITLTIGALGIFAPSPRWVEPLIALSIAYVGVENLMKQQVDSRWKVAFGFGLLHGFGFSGALADVGTEVARSPLLLLGFNLGVELGQLGVLMLIVPVLVFARRRETVWPWVRRGLSLGVVAPGLVWFVMRVSEP